MDFVQISPEIRRISCGFHLLKSAGFRTDFTCWNPADFERPIARNGKPNVLNLNKTVKHIFQQIKCLQNNYYELTESRNLIKRNLVISVYWYITREICHINGWYCHLHFWYWVDTFRCDMILWHMKLTVRLCTKARSWKQCSRGKKFQVSELIHIFSVTRPGFFPRGRPARWG